MKFKGKVKEHLLWVRCAVVVLGAFVAFENLRNGGWIGAILGAVLVVAAFFSKEHVISEEGSDVVYKIFGIPRHNLWTWQEITSIHTDYEKMAPDVMVHIGRDIVTRTFVFNQQDARGVLDLAEKMNPDIYIRDMNAEEMDKLAKAAVQKREAARKAKEAKKAAKK